MPRELIPITGGQVTNDDEYSSPNASRVINLQVDQRGVNTSRPGLKSYTTPTDTATPTVAVETGSDQRIVGLHEFGDYMIIVRANRRIFRADEDGTSLDITDVKLPGSAYPTFHELKNGNLLICGGGAPVVIDATLRAKLFCKNYSPSATHACTVASTLLLNHFGSDKVHFSGIEDHSRHTNNPLELLAPGLVANDPAGFIKAGSRSDNVDAMAALKDRIFLFGKPKMSYEGGSVEVYHPTGNPFDPFRLDSGQVASDIGAPRSLCYADATLWWMDNERRVIKLAGRQPQVVSLDIESQLQDFKQTDDCIAHPLNITGDQLITFTFPNQALTMVYNVISGHWYEWKRWNSTGGYWMPMPMAALAKQHRWNKWYCGGLETAGKVHQFDPDTYQDDSSDILRIRRGPFVDRGTRVGVKRMEFILEGGVATTSASSDLSGYNPYMDVRWRDEDRHWQRWRELRLGKTGDLSLSRFMNRGGSYRQRQIEWRYSGNTQFSLARIWEELDARLG